MPAAFHPTDGTGFSVYTEKTQNHRNDAGGLFKSCRFIIMHARLKVPAKNSPALLFLSRVKAADCCCFSFFFFSPAEEEQSRGILGGNFQTRVHDGNKVAGLKETAWVRLAGRKSLL